MVEKVTSPDNIVTDGLVLKRLAEQGIDPQFVEFWHDYAPRSKGKGYNPYAKFYRDLKSDTRIMVVSGLPMCNEQGQKLVPLWTPRGQQDFEQASNLFNARTNKLETTLVALNDQPNGIKKGWQVQYRPQLWISNTEIQPISEYPTLLDVDPQNPNYQYNTLQWDYGVCTRRVRTVQGRIHGYWIFTSRPAGTIRIRYNQIGQYRLKLKRYRVNADEELITLEQFDALVAEYGYPVVLDDSTTFFPDAGVNSVDGMVAKEQGGGTWGALQGGAGTYFDDSSATGRATRFRSGTPSPNYMSMYRSIYLFDTSGLQDSAVILSGTKSIYIWDVVDEWAGAEEAVNIFSAAPASDTELVNADYGSLGTTVYCDTEILLGSLNASGYNDYVLNPTGLAAISRITVSKFGSRGSIYDAPNSPPTWEDNKNMSAKNYMAEQGSGFKPKLVVTYSLPTSGGNPMGQLLSAGFV